MVFGVSCVGSLVAPARHGDDAGVGSLSSVARRLWFPGLPCVYGTDGTYRRYVLAYLNNLTYLDYAMVMKSEIVAAREQYQVSASQCERSSASDRVRASASECCGERGLFPSAPPPFLARLRRRAPTTSRVRAIAPRVVVSLFRMSRVAPPRVMCRPRR